MLPVLSLQLLRQCVSHPRLLSSFAYHRYKWYLCRSLQELRGVRCCLLLSVSLLFGFWLRLQSYNLFSCLQIFFNFFCTFFSLSVIRHIYSDFPALPESSLFRWSCVPLVCWSLSCVLCSGRVLVVCRSLSCVLFPQSYAHTRVHIHTRTGIFRR